MTRFEQATKIIAESYRKDCEFEDCSIKELFRAWQVDAEDARAEFVDILYEAGFEAFTEDGEILEDNGTVKTLKQLIKAVKSYEL